MNTVTAHAQSKRLRAIAFFLGKCVLAGALLTWLVRSGRLEFRTLATVRFGWDMTGLVVGQFFMLLFPLVRWYVLVSARGLNVSFARAMTSGMVGYFAAIFVPAGLGSDATRFAYAYRQNQGRRADLFSTFVMDRLLGLLALTLLATVFGGILFASLRTEAVLRIAAASGVCLVGLLGLSAILCSSRLALLLGPVRHWTPVSRISHAMQAYRRHPWALGTGFVLSILGHLSAFSAAYFAFRAMGVTTSVFAVLATTPLVTLSGSVPLAPLGLGVTDSVAVMLYSTVGLTDGAEVNMLLRVVSVAISLCGGAAWLLPSPAAVAVEAETNDPNSAVAWSNDSQVPVTR